MICGVRNRTFEPIAKRSIIQNPNFFKQFAYDCSKHRSQCRPKVVRPYTFWESIFGRKKKKPPKESCRLLACQKCEFEEIPCFVQTMMNKMPRSNVQKTKGTAYILEIPSVHIPHAPKTQEEEIIHRMERDKDAPFKQNLCNPMPRFTTVGARLLDLQSRKLHPLYQKYEVPPKKRRTSYPSKCDFKKLKLGKEIGPSTDPADKIHPKDKYVATEFKMADMPHSHRHRLKDYEVNLESPLEVSKKLPPVKKTKGFSHLKGCGTVSCSERV